jgi:hypothetical protein
MINNKYKLESTTSPVYSGVSPFQMPYPSAPKEGTKGDEYEKFFMQNLFYIMSFYDQPNNNISFPFDWNGNSGNVGGGYNNNGVGVNLDESTISWWRQPSSQMFLNYAYYMQRQPNLNANHLAKAVASTNAHATWARGGRIASIIDKMCGIFQEQLEDVRFSPEPLSASAKNYRQKKIEREEFLYLIKPYWEKYLQEVAEMPQQAKPFETPQEVQEWMDTGIKDFLADVYLNITVDNWEKQYWLDDSQKIFRDAVICDCTGVEHIIERGFYKKIVHPPYNLIVDTRIDDPFGRWRRLAGVIENLTLTEAYYRYPQLDEEDRKDLYNIAISAGAMDNINQSFPNLVWWRYPTNSNGINYQDVSVTVVRCYWIAPEEIDGEIVQTVYTGEVLGNRFLLNYGKADNIVENPYNPYVPMLPLQIFTPNMLLGTYNSFVSKVRTLQDDYDRLRFKQMDMIAKAKGKVIAWNGEKFGNDKQVVDINQDIEKYGQTMDSPSGQAGNPSDNKPLGYLFDMTLDPGYESVGRKLQQIYAEIEMYMGQTAITLGENTRYIGKEAYRDSQEVGASGTYNIYTNTLRFIQINMDMGINIKKNLYAHGLLKDEAENVIGSQGLRILKECGELGTRDFGICLKINDKVSADKKKELFQLALAYAQNSQDGYTLNDLMKMYLAPTVTKLKDDILAIDERLRKEKQAQRESQMQHEQQMEQQRMQNDNQKTAFIEHSKLVKTKTLIQPKQEKLDTERAELGMPPLHPELSQQPPIGAQPPQENVNPQQPQPSE